MSDFPALPADFRIGAATAAYQIEGAHDRDGRAPSIWDDFVRRPGKIADGSSGATATGHYDRLEEDLDLMAALGLEVYRFSISWSRVMPEGRPNPAGLAFYDRLIDGLIARGISPMPTLFHWDMPLDLHQRHGGWRGRDTAAHFADYAAAMMRHFGDRVPRFITLNEPWEHAYLGYAAGEHAPGEKRLWNFPKVIHHQLLGHGRALEAMRAERSGVELGITLSMTPIEPVTPADEAAAARLNEFVNFITYDAVFRGAYPADLWRRLRFIRPHVGPDDMRIISGKVDFVGLNNYSRAPGIRRWWMPFIGADSPREKPAAREYVRDGVQFTTMGWEVCPDAIGQCLRWIRERYGNPPTWITENGIALADAPDGAGRVEDPLRIAYLRAHMGEAEKALAEGSDLRGYLVWSLMDNFEWALGQSKRFGLIHVDYPSLTRRIKASGHWIRDLIEAKS